MKSIKGISRYFLCCAVVLASLPFTSSAFAQVEKPRYYVLDKTLSRFKSDFNALKDKTRLVFIVGPSCGNCLRGMDDLNRHVVQALQKDARVHTLVLHVPALNATEKHASAAVALMLGPNVTHYWDPLAESSYAFGRALGPEIKKQPKGFAWDVWMAFAPGDTWGEQNTPPAPDFWHHQLWRLSKTNYLDTKKFSASLKALLGKAAKAKQAAFKRAAEHTTGILKVDHTSDLMVDEFHESRGGVDKLKGIQTMRYEGRAAFNGQSYPLVITHQRPHEYKRLVKHPQGDALVRWDGKTILRQGPVVGLSAPVHDKVIRAQEIDHWFTDWQAKGHKVTPIGMKSVDNHLPWLMQTDLANGQTWYTYMDSHKGDAYRDVLISPEGAETVVIEYGDYQAVQGLRLAHQAKYYVDGALVLTDTFNKIHMTYNNP